MIAGSAKELPSLWRESVVDELERRAFKSQEENKALVRRYLEKVPNGGDVDVIDELFAPNMHQRVKKTVAWFHTIFPHLRETIEDLIAEGDTVAARWTFHGTHQDEFEGIPPTDKQVTMTGMSFYYIGGGKILKDWAEWDKADLIEQLRAHSPLG